MTSKSLKEEYTKMIEEQEESAADCGFAAWEDHRDYSLEDLRNYFFRLRDFIYEI